jgi:hypothetical protein
VGHDLAVTVGGRRLAVDARDVSAWSGRVWTGTPDAEWRVDAERYVADHPRSAGTAEAQRLAILRVLAAGPAQRGQLLAAMRTAGYVGADDFENRLRDLKAGDTRAGGRSGLAVAGDGQRWWLEEPFPLLDGPDRRALGFARAMIDRLDGPMSLRASAALERVLPGVAVSAEHDAPARYQAPPADLERFHSAMEQRRPIRVRYFSLNSGREGTYDLVPVEYVTVGATVKAICVEVTPAGRKDDRDLQFALDRLRSVADLPDWPTPEPDQLQLRRSRIMLHVTDPLYQVIRDRNLFGIAADAHAVQDAEDDSWQVTGDFPEALAWDVMEQLCAWAGNAQVRQPYWLVNAVVRRLTAGLEVMVEGGPFELVKPEVDRTFASHAEALSVTEPLPQRTGPRRLAPRD